MADIKESAPIQSPEQNQTKTEVVAQQLRNPYELLDGIINRFFNLKEEYAMFKTKKIGSHSQLRKTLITIIKDAKEARKSIMVEVNSWDKKKLKEEHKLRKEQEKQLKKLQAEERRKLKEINKELKKKEAQGKESAENQPSSEKSATDKVKKEKSAKKSKKKLPESVPDTDSDEVASDND